MNIADFKTQFADKITEFQEVLINAYKRANYALNNNTKETYADIRTKRQREHEDKGDFPSNLDNIVKYFGYWDVLQEEKEYSTFVSDLQDALVSVHTALFGSKTVLNGKPNYVPGVLDYLETLKEKPVLATVDATMHKTKLTTPRQERSDAAKEFEKTQFHQDTEMEKIAKKLEEEEAAEKAATQKQADDAANRENEKRKEEGLGLGLEGERDAEREKEAQSDEWQIARGGKKKPKNPQNTTEETNVDFTPPPTQRRGRLADQDRRDKRQLAREELQKRIREKDEILRDAMKQARQENRDLKREMKKVAKAQGWELEDLMSDGEGGYFFKTRENYNRKGR